MQFTPEQQQVLQATVDRIIPPDDYPGAWEVGVGEYLSRQFEGDLKHLVETYRIGLDALNREAMALYEVGFVGLTHEQQDIVLRRVEAGEVLATWPIVPEGFMRMLVNHAAEGYYSSPIQGGNRDAVSWRMIGFENESHAEGIRG